jgi:uracil-DNA glycosylase
MALDEVLKRNFPVITPEYESFARAKDSCRKCPLFGHYKQVVQSEGNTKNPIFMFIGEAPGDDERKQCRPFIGMAGQELRFQFKRYPKIFRRDTVLLSNVVACRPLDNKFPELATEYKTKFKAKDGQVYTQGSFNKEHKDVTTCSETWLMKEIELVKPKIIVTLGAPALRLVRGDFGITKHRGKWKFLPKYMAWSFATYHPSYVMRSKGTNMNYVFTEFQQDIENLATMYPTMMGDPRYSMNQIQCARMNAIEFAAQQGLYGITGINGIYDDFFEAEPPF